MQKLIPFLLLLTGLVACNTSKKTSSKSNNSGTPEVTANPEQIGQTGVFKVKILRISCASLVAQIMDEAYYNYGEEWAPYNVRMKEAYKHVVNIANKCVVPDDVKENDIIQVKLITEEEANQKPCVACMMMDYPPSKKITVKYIGMGKIK